MDAKKAMVIFIALILLGEALYLIFINNPSAHTINNIEEQKEIFTAIVKAKVTKLERITTKNKEFANVLSFCSQNKIVDEYIISCENQENLSNLSKAIDAFISLYGDDALNDVRFKYKLITEKVVTKIKVSNFNQDIDITIPYYIDINKTIELEGIATIINDTVSTINVNNIYAKNESINESAKVIKAKIINYIYTIPFDYRHIINSNDTFRNIVYTNMTNVKKPDFVTFIGDGYIIVKDNATSQEIKNYYTDAVMPNITYETNETIKGNYNFSFDILYDLNVNTSIGLIDIKYRSSKMINENDTLNLSIDLIKSGDIVLKRRVIINS